MLTRTTLQPLMVGDNAPAKFDFTNELEPEETVDSAVVTAAVMSGDDSSPSAILDGSPVVATPVVTQQIEPTTEGVIYKIIAKATTSLGNILQKIGILAIPSTGPTYQEPEPMSSVVASYDSGSISVELSSTPVLSATQNAAGGVYQVNVYSNISVAAGAGLIEVLVQWFDMTTEQLITASVAVLTATAEDDPRTETFPIYTKPGSQVLIGTNFAGVTGVPTYRVQAEILNLA